MYCFCSALNHRIRLSKPPRAVQAHEAHRTFLWWCEAAAKGRSRNSRGNQIPAPLAPEANLPARRKHGSLLEPDAERLPQDRDCVENTFSPAKTKERQTFKGVTYAFPLVSISGSNPSPPPRCPDSAWYVACAVCPAKRRPEAHMTHPADSQCFLFLHK